MRAAQPGKCLICVRSRVIEQLLHSRRAYGAGQSLSIRRPEKPCPWKAINHLFPRDLNLRLHTIRRHVQGEVEGIDTIVELERPANQWFYINLTGAHQSQGSGIDVSVTEYGFDRGFFCAQGDDVDRHRLDR